MLAKRIILLLDVKKGEKVKGINFEISNTGDPIEIAKKYSDEVLMILVFLDITATNDVEKQLLKWLKKLQKRSSYFYGRGRNRFH